MTSKWSFILLLSVLLLLAGCQTQEGTPAGEEETARFEFIVDPSAEQVDLIAHQGNGIVPTAEGPRVLTPGSEIELAYFDYAFLPGNKLEIYATFRNVTSDAYFMGNLYGGDFSFKPVLTPSEGNYLSSIEPVMNSRSCDLGNDESLSPDEVMREHCDRPDPWYTFEVTHKGQPFSYFVNVNALVGDLLDVIGAGEPLMQDGKLVYVGGSRPHPGYQWFGGWDGLTLLRYLADGSLDPSFGVDGITNTPFVASLYWVYGPPQSLLQSDNHIITWGHATSGGGSLPHGGSGGILVRHSPDGEYLGWSFVGGLFQDNKWEDVTILPDDTIVITGHLWWNEFRSYVTSELDFDPIALLRDSVGPVYPNGKAVYGGWNDIYPNPDTDVVLVQHNTSDYSLDTGFGTNGVVTINVGGNDQLTGLAASGTAILVTGTSDACASGTFSFLVQADGSYNPATMCVP